MTPDQQMKWLKKQASINVSRERRKKLRESDKDKIWGLMLTYQNQTIIARMMGVTRMTIYRFLQKYPIPKTFKLEKSLEGYPEIQTWITRQKMFAKDSVIKTYLLVIEKFHRYMKEKHPERQRPMLWTSDDIMEFVQSFKPYQQHAIIVPLRQLGKKCPQQFPMIDLGLLPTRKTHRAKRSLAGKKEYYLDIDEIRQMIAVCDLVRDKAILSFLFNTGCRTGIAKEGLGLAGVKIEDLRLDQHQVKIKDKGGIIWNVLGLSDQTCEYLRQYLNERGNPTSGFLFVNGHNSPLSNDQINGIIKEAGKRAGIEGKRLVAKTFRKSLVKYALEDCGMNPISLIGTGKETKTCFCVGWTGDPKVLMTHYAPKLEARIETDRQKFKL